MMNFLKEVVELVEELLIFKRQMWEFGISRCKLLYGEWINNKVLLYSTGNYIQYPVINHNGKEYEKEDIYV